MLPRCHFSKGCAKPENYIVAILIKHNPSRPLESMLKSQMFYKRFFLISCSFISALLHDRQGLRSVNEAWLEKRAFDFVGVLRAQGLSCPCPGLWWNRSVCRIQANFRTERRRKIRDFGSWRPYKFNFMTRVGRTKTAHTRARARHGPNSFQNAAYESRRHHRRKRSERRDCMLWMGIVKDAVSRMFIRNHYIIVPGPRQEKKKTR